MRIRSPTFSIEGQVIFVGKPTKASLPYFRRSYPAAFARRRRKMWNQGRIVITPQLSAMNCAMRVVGIPTNSHDAPRDFRTLRISSREKNMVNPEWALSHGGLLP
jgi:hypothetical protein